MNAMSKKIGVKATASTGIAATLLINGTTAHRAFFIPNDVDSNSKSKLSFESTCAEVLRNVELIIIDEIGFY